MKLIDNWREALKAYSTWALGAVVAIPTIWLQVPDELKALIPAQGMAKITVLVAVAGLIGRFVDQKHEG
ncbi:hypothetical protein [Asticcacaulis sp.]|uniref:DUF7940 domain-containing protein n=1 Tax=Asticcacaulis sp. TaxID=1872648 RepID=UPI003F7C2531